MSSSIILTWFWLSFFWSSIWRSSSLDNCRFRLTLCLSGVNIILTNSWIRICFPLIFASQSNFFVLKIFICPRLMSGCIVHSWFRLILLWSSMRRSSCFYYSRFGLSKCLTCVDVILTNSWILIRLPPIFASQGNFFVLKILISPRLMSSSIVLSRFRISFLWSSIGRSIWLNDSRF